MKLRAQLLLLVVAAIVPVLVVALVAFTLLIDHERETMRREALGRTRSVMSAVDADLHGVIATLQALATQPDWLNIGLATPERKQLVDAALPFGKRARFGADDHAFAQAVSTRQPAIGDILARADVHHHAVRVRVIALTGYGQPGDRRRALEAGFDAHLVKPVAAEELAQAMASLD